MPSGCVHIAGDESSWNVSRDRLFGLVNVINMDDAVDRSLKRTFCQCGIYLGRRSGDRTLGCLVALSTIVESATAWRAAYLRAWRARPAVRGSISHRRGRFVVEIRWNAHCTCAICVGMNGMDEVTPTEVFAEKG